MAFITSLATLLLFQLIGEVLSLTLIPNIPGPVAGMTLLFVFMMVIKARFHTAKKLMDTVTSGANTLLSHLSLLFIPAGVGLISHLDLVAQQWLPIFVAIIIGSIITMSLTAWLMVFMIKIIETRK